MTPLELSSYAKSSIKNTWVGFCKAMQSVSQVDFKNYVNTINSVIGHMSKEEASLVRAVYNLTSAAYESTPIVNYIIKKTLFDSLIQSKLTDGSISLAEAFSLPYPITALTVEGQEREWTVFRDLGNITMISSSTHGTIAVRNDKALNTLPDWDAKHIQAQIKILAYLTNNQDVITKKKKIEIPNESPSKTRKKKGRFLEVIEGEVGGIFTKNIKLFNEQQNAPGNKDEINPVTDRKMKPHMRAGHWHTYRHGPGRTLTKLVFVHACAVNASEIARGTTLMVDVE